ncbi:MAG: toxin-antitoxin system HicB family antitoxin [Clostridiales bacterium]|jgi:predicted HicB family RNase H-like nuclease|nr:toxin-antitoxin system HicB family antitoxin [Clostridiales bacterium]
MRSEKEQITLRLTPELGEQIQKEAAQRNISVNAYIILLINKSLGNVNLLD